MRIHRYKLSKKINKDKMPKKLQFICNFRDYDLSILINLSRDVFNDMEDIAVVDNSFPGPYLPFHNYFDKNIANGTASAGIAAKYNMLMDSISWFERVE